MVRPWNPARHQHPPESQSSTTIIMAHLQVSALHTVEAPCSMFFLFFWLHAGVIECFYPGTDVNPQQSHLQPIDEAHILGSL